jgi:hypothetical protein
MICDIKPVNIMYFRLNANLIVELHFIYVLLYKILNL